jgi:hypothetical protein
VANVMKGKSEVAKRSSVGGAKLYRSETVTVRLDPKVRYLAEIASRVQRRTLSSFIEWAVEESLKNVELRTSYGNTVTVAAAGSVPSHNPQLWDVDDADRFIKLAHHFPHLLSHSEQRMWKLASETYAILDKEKGDELLGTKSEELVWFRSMWALLVEISSSDSEEISAAELAKLYKKSK